MVSLVLEIRASEVKMDLAMLEHKLPLAMQSFTELRARGYVYVDKTPYVQVIAQRQEPQILARPRRFGKSTLVSTLKELFLHGIEPYDGHDSYFKGLAIESTWQDLGQYLVLSLNFYNLGACCDSVAQFEQNLIEKVSSFGSQHGLTLPDAVPDFWEQFSALLEQVPERSLVLLIDEYDSPLLYHFVEEDERKACKLVYRALFTSIKSYREKFRCVFMTGVTRLANLDLGTAARGLSDVSYDADLAACCGYTRAELKQYFAEHLRYAAAVRVGAAPESWNAPEFGSAAEEVSSEQIEALLDDLSAWYGGFTFAGKPEHQVLSTWSVLRFLSDKRARLQPHWFMESGLGFPKLLRLTLERLDINLRRAEAQAREIVIGAQKFAQSALSHPEANPYGILVDAGYVTLGEPFTHGDFVHLRCPNLEVKKSYDWLVSHLKSQQDAYAYDGSGANTIEVLESLDPERYRVHFNQSFALLSDEHFKQMAEGFVWNAMHIYLMGTGLKPRSRVLSETGPAFCEIDLPWRKLTIVLEFAFEPNPDPDMIERKLEATVQKLKEERHGINLYSAAQVARFVMVFCPALAIKGFARVIHVDTIDNRTSDLTPAGFAGLARPWLSGN